MEIEKLPIARDDSAEDDDLSLVRWMLSLTPDERLDVLQGFVDSAATLRDDRTTEV
jgi:hypothetical protein